jgi:hypothetical protein
MAKTPIENCRGIDTLVRVLKKRATGKGLNIVTKTRTHEEHLVMVAPATLAWCVNDAGIGKKAGEPLRVLLINVQMLDFLDEGQWYRFVPAMLNSGAQISVCANTKAPMKQRKSMVAKALKKTMRIDASLKIGELTALLGENDPSEFDIAVCFGSLFGGGENVEVFDGLRQLVGSEVPVYLADMSEPVSLLNRCAAESRGIASTKVSDENPYALVSKVSGENWGKFISRLTCVTEDGSSENDEIKEQKASALNVVGQMVLDSHRAGFAEQPFEVGSTLLYGDEGVVHFMDGLGIDRQGQIYDCQNTEKIGALEDKWLELVDDYSSSWTDTERMVWAAHVKYFWIAQNNETPVPGVKTEKQTKVA